MPQGRFERIETMTPQQQQLLSQLLAGMGGPLGAGLQNIMQLLSGAPEALEAYQRPELRRFEEETVPGIAERFAGLGAQASSAFPQALGAAGTALSERLAAQRAGLQQQAMGQLAGLLGMGLGTRPFETMYRPGGPGFWGAMAPGIGAGLGGGIGRAISGLLGL